MTPYIRNISVRVGKLPGAFVPGVTWPYYELTEDLSGAKNVGNLPDADFPRTNYSGTVTNGVTNIDAGTYNNLNFVNTIVNIRGNVTFNNCRFVMISNDYVLSDSIKGLVRNVNGSGGLVTFNDCELHCRAQRVMNCFVGRNTIFNRCVLAGGVDGPSDSAAGSAPQNFGIIRNDCWIGYNSWWRTPSMPWEGHGSDKQVHADVSQIATTLGSEWHNITLISAANPYSGTGTPNSGSDTGNSYVPSSGTNYIRTQAQQEADRATYLNWNSTPSQSYLGLSRRLSTTSSAPPDGTSWACIMGNRNGGVVDKVLFSGGTASVNLMDAALTGGWSIKRSLFYNDMVTGPTASGNDRRLDPTIKGYAMLIRSDLAGVFDIPVSGADRNIWFDGTTVVPTYA